jgi:adenylate kinase
VERRRSTPRRTTATAPRARRAIDPDPRVGWVALTGTPGTGKTTVASHLPARWSPIEVGELAESLGAARPRRGGGYVVDLERLARKFPPAGARVRVLVGHLAHLLPVRTAIVLRCDPTALAGRLRGKGRASERHDNLVCEAIDLVAEEARAPGRRVLELDTTTRSPELVARSIVRWVRSGRPRSGARPRWLARRGVTDVLLGKAR